MNAHKSIQNWNSWAQKQFINPIAKMVWDACVLDVQAFKPGNVHCFAKGHDMTVDDFLKSAAAISEIMGNVRLSLGERILDSALATKEAVSINTNIGIILLCAPLAGAASKDGRDLRLKVEQAIDDADIGDSENILKAIRIANPSGLGSVQQHDVANTAVAPIKEIMAEAQDRDSIAHQYANGYPYIFEVGLPHARAFQQNFKNETTVVTALFLLFLSEYPDSHIVRQFGLKTACSVQVIAASLLQNLADAGELDEVFSEFSRYDTLWKNTELNPGTSADLTVATMLALKIEENVG